MVVGDERLLHLPAPRDLTKAEQEVGAFALTGTDFARLRTGRKLRIGVTTAAGTRTLVLELAGLAGALDVIDAGCPVRTR